MEKIWSIRWNLEGYGTAPFTEEFTDEFGNVTISATVSVNWWPDFENTGTASTPETVIFKWKQDREETGDIDVTEFFNDGADSILKYLIIDYDYNNELFSWDIKPDETFLFTANNGSPWSGLTYSFDYGSVSMDPDFFVTELLTVEDEEQKDKNEITVEIKEPVNGSWFEFCWNPSWPEADTEEIIRFNFVTTATQSSTATNLYIEVKGTLEEQIAEIEEVFNSVKNPANEWEFIIDNEFITFRPNNYSPVGCFDSFDPEIIPKKDQPSQQPISFQKIRVRSPFILRNVSQQSVKRARVTMNFVSQPLDGNRFRFTIRKNGIGIFSFDKTYNTSTNSFPLIQIGGSLTDTVLNTISNFNTYHSNPAINFIYSQTQGLKILIDVIGDTSDVFTLQVYQNDMLVGGNTINGPVNTEISGFDSTEFQVWSWKGNIVNTFGDADYTITKQKNSDTQTSVYIDWTKLVRKDLESNISQYIQGSFVTNITPTKWVRVRRRNKLFGSYISDNNTYYWISDGYLENLESNNMPKILWSGFKYAVINNTPTYTIKRRFSRKSLVKIPYNAEGFFGYIQTPQGFLGGLNGNVTDNSQVYRYLKIVPPENGNTWTYEFNYYQGAVWKVEVEWYDECKYDTIDLYFKNKWGVLETITTSKLSKRKLSTSEDDYKRSVMDENGFVNKNKHVKTVFNKTGREEWTLNTEVLKDYSNEFIDELFLSEELWMTYFSPNALTSFQDQLFTQPITPVILKDKTFTHKTSLNDRIVQYTFNVELSQEKINNLQ